jgi:DNA polymerase
MESPLDHRAARALLEWMVELGADEPIGEAPVNRYAETAEPAAAPAPAPGTAPAAAAPAPAPGPAPEVAGPAAADRAAAAAADLPALKAALAGFEHCELKRGARNLVFADGVPGAAVMILGEAPGRDEDREGRPFVGRAGRLLDAMFAAIGLSRTGTGAGALYITNVVPWRPPQNRTPTAEEIAMMRPFVARHVALADPKLLVVMGNTACAAAFGRTGITRFRGAWDEAFGRPALPMLHPAYLLRTPAAKRETWADLLTLKARLKELS